ncbi:MAG: DUF2330 domain-containing protein [Trueperaceae bacterium]|nr:MAG: DUF2330 domain-containing protein [Trueperaceae bacterium]
MVVPVPTVLREEQIQVGDPNIFERIDAYSAPRLVEYFDTNPCQARVYRLEQAPSAAGAADESRESARARAQALGVTIEDAFTVGEYDILILSAEESAGLETWLTENDYRIPEGASEALAPYLAKGMKFFVAKVNLQAFEASGVQKLRPLMMAFESDHFMLPIQLGMVNAAGPQDLVAYLLSPHGRIDVSNYRTVKIPSNVNVPEFVADDFADVYRALFRRSYQREGENVIFLEYAWDMSWCDPCAAEPLSLEELRQAGVFWLHDEDVWAPNVFLTRLHVRYTPEKFPEDLMFTVTDERENFQGRYIMQRPFAGELDCEAGREYVESVRERQEHEAQVLANLTGWDIDTVRSRMGIYDPLVSVRPWWERVFDSFR